MSAYETGHISGLRKWAALRKQYLSLLLFRPTSAIDVRASDSVTKTAKHRRLMILALVITTVVSLLVLEASLRLFRYALLPFVGVQHQPCIYVEDQQIGFRHRPSSTGWIHRYFEMDNVVEINSDGFHDIERRDEQKAVAEAKRKTILVVGDSFTASLHVPIPHTWTQTLERELRDTSVVNLGLEATGTDAHLAILEKYLPEYEPDIVILAFFENDMEDIRRTKLYGDCYNGNALFYQDQEQKEQMKLYVDENDPSAATRWLFDRVFIFRLASSFFSSSSDLLRNNMLFPHTIGLEFSGESAEPRNDIDQLLTDFRQLSQQWGFRLLVIPVPTRMRVNVSLETLTENASPQVLAELEVIDIWPIFTSLRESEGAGHRSLFWKYDGHFNAKGNELFGLSVARQLEQLSTVESD